MGGQGGKQKAKRREQKSETAAWIWDSGGATKDQRQSGGEKAPKPKSQTPKTSQASNPNSERLREQRPNRGVVRVGFAATGDSGTPARDLGGCKAVAS